MHLSWYYLSLINHFFIFKQQQNINSKHEFAFICPNHNENPMHDVHSLILFLKTQVYIHTNMHNSQKTSKYSIFNFSRPKLKTFYLWCCLSKRSIPNVSIVVKPPFPLSSLKTFSLVITFLQIPFCSSS